MLYNYLLLFLLVSLLVYIHLYRLEIKKIQQQMVDIKKRESNRLLTQSYYTKELNGLVGTINETLMKERELRLELEKKEALQQELLTNVSHDIRTPLTSLDGYIQLLIAADNPEDEERYLSIIQNRLEKLSQMLDQMFLYMKLEDAHYPVNLEPLDLKQLSLSHLFNFYDIFQSKGQEPQINMPNEPVWVEASEDLMDQVLPNVIKNALLHGQGDLVLTIKEDGSLHISNSFTGSYQGDPNTLFERFSTGSASRSEESTGLGLSIAHSAVEKMGGHIEAKTEGQVFTVSIYFNQP